LAAYGDGVVAIDAKRQTKENNLWEKAEEYYRNALLLQPENPEKMNHLAYFLINKCLLKNQFYKDYF
jgi:Flp pilus assembly protein TadD